MPIRGNKFFYKSFYTITTTVGCSANDELFKGEKQINDDQEKGRGSPRFHV